MSSSFKDVGKVDYTADIKGDSHIDNSKKKTKIEKLQDCSGASKVIAGDYMKAGGDTFKGDNFSSVKTYAAAATPVEEKIKVKVLVKGRTKLVCLLAAKNTLKDLKKQIKDDKCIDNLDKAIFQQKDEDDELVDLCDSHQLCSGDKVHVTYETE